MMLSPTTTTRWRRLRLMQNGKKVCCGNSIGRNGYCAYSSSSSSSSSSSRRNKSASFSCNSHTTVILLTIACCILLILSPPCLLLLPLVESRPPSSSSSSSTSISKSGSIPRSNNRYTNYFNDDNTQSSSCSSSSTDDGSSSSSSSVEQPYHHPPWNLSPHINPNGFLNEFYSRIPGAWEHAANIRGKHGVNSKNSNQLYTIPVQVRQVPGDGNCLFHSIAICLYHATNGEDTYRECLFGPWRSWGLMGNKKSALLNRKDQQQQQQPHLQLQQDKQQQQQQHLPMDTIENIAQLRRTSLALRNAAVDVLSASSSTSTQQGRVLGFGGLGNLISRGGDSIGIMGNTMRNSSFPSLSSSRRLFLQGDEYISSSELLNAASSQFNINGEEYCSLMRSEGYWGGGPEIVALCNYLRRPIHVYELIPKEDSSIGVDGSGDGAVGGNECPIRTSDRFTLRRMACFGSPKFDRKSPLHILSADSRFPDVDPKRVRKAGNHFLALFPVSTTVLQQQRPLNGDVDSNNRNSLARRSVQS